MKKICLLILPFFILTTATAQQFNNINAGITNLKESSVAWGDFDKDGDDDIIANGFRSNDTPVTLLFRNDEGSFIEIDPGIVNSGNGSVAWGDFDADGDLDILVTGETENDPVSAIYRNDNGVFTDIGAALLNVGDGEGAWGDYDNDGDLDIFITGSLLSKLFENDNGDFIETSFVFPDMQASSVAFGDYDNDGDLDIFLMGDTGAGMFCYIFENTGNDFVQTSHVFEGLFAGTACWVDFDNDGDLDLNFSGLDMYLESRYRLYRNNGDKTFTMVNTSIPDISSSTSEWGDMDNDGDLDLFVQGKCNSCGTYYAGMYKNNNGNLQNHSGTSFTYAYDGSAGWTDYDNDGDVDLIVSGKTASGSAFTKIYQNTDNSNTFSYNTNPDPPSNLIANVSGNMAEISWDAGNDLETPVDGLSYNVRIGFTPTSQEVQSPMATEAGTRLICEIGNTGQNTSWSIQNLGAGTYYFSLQTIDQCGSGSAFAAAESFTILNTGISDIQNNKNILLLQNPVNEELRFAYGNFSEHLNVKVLDQSGRIMLHHDSRGGENSVNVSDLSSGVYILLIENDSGISSSRFIKR